MIGRNPELKGDVPSLSVFDQWQEMLKGSH